MQRSRLIWRHIRYVWNQNLNRAFRKMSTFYLNGCSGAGRCGPCVLVLSVLQWSMSESAAQSIRASLSGLCNAERHRLEPLPITNTIYHHQLPCIMPYYSIVLLNSFPQRLFTSEGETKLEKVYFHKKSVGPYEIEKLYNECQQNFVLINFKFL